MNLTITLSKTRETKNTVRFDAPDSEVPSLYISKAAFDGEFPESVTLNVVG